MTVIKLKESNPIEAHIAQLKIWQRDCKKFQQTALYDLLSETIVLMKKLHKEKPDTPTENFTHTAADLAFSDYIRARANYCCERCGKQYPKKSTALQCSHHFSRRFYSIRYHPDNAAALCHHCHNYWFSKDILESAAWLHERLSQSQIDELIRLKKLPNATQKLSASQQDEIAEYYRNLLKDLKNESQAV